MSQLLFLFPPQDTFTNYCYELNNKKNIEEFLAFNKLRNKYLRGTKQIVIGHVDTKCFKCKEKIEEGNAALVSYLTIETNDLPSEKDSGIDFFEPPNVLDLIFHHPKCLTCNDCQENLDTFGIYFLQESSFQIYCGRHFAQTLKRRCSGCDELIFADECIRAEGLDWHVNHFLCAYCDDPIIFVPNQTPYRILPDDTPDPALAGLPICHKCRDNLDFNAGKSNGLPTIVDNGRELPTNFCKSTLLNESQQLNYEPEIEEEEEEEGEIMSNECHFERDSFNSSTSDISSYRHEGTSRSHNYGRRDRRVRHVCLRSALNKGAPVKDCSTCSNTTTDDSSALPSSLNQIPNFWQNGHQDAIPPASNYNLIRNIDGSLSPQGLSPFGKGMGRRSLPEPALTPPPKPEKGNMHKMGRLLRAFTRFKGPNRSTKLPLKKRLHDHRPDESKYIEGDDDILYPSKVSLEHNGMTELSSSFVDVRQEYMGDENTRFELLKDLSYAIHHTSQNDSFESAGPALNPDRRPADLNVTYKNDSLRNMALSCIMEDEETAEDNSESRVLAAYASARDYYQTTPSKYQNRYGEESIQYEGASSNKVNKFCTKYHIIGIDDPVEYVETRFNTDLNISSKPH